MSDRVFMGVFRRPSDVLDATRAARRRGFPVLEVYSPHALHGLDEALGLRPSWLRWVALGLGTFGAGFALWLQYWTSAVSWPINIGGRPFAALPAYVPVIFEMGVLFAGVGTVIAFFVGLGLRPGRPARVPHPGVTDDRFVLLVGAEGVVDAQALRRLLEEHGAIETLTPTLSPAGGEGARRAGEGGPGTL